MLHPPIDRKHLAIALTRIPDPPAPRPDREQVRTPGEVATDLLMAGWDAGDLEGKRVMDLGTGSGVLAVGAALLGAAKVVAVDIDSKALEVARAAAEREEVDDVIVFHHADVGKLTPEAVAELAGGPIDTTVMNPPFGADLASRARGGDRVFLSLAFRSAPRLLLLHPAHTERFLLAFARDAGFAVGKQKDVDFPIPAKYAHHEDLVRAVKVGLYRLERVRPAGTPPEKRKR